MLRAQSRVVSQSIAMGTNILDTLQNYTIGSGFLYKSIPKADVHRPLGAAVQDDVDQFIELNDWRAGGVESEIHDRFRQDGEDFVALFATPKGVVVRLVDSENVVEPYGFGRDIDRRLGISIPTNWKYGVHTYEKDIQQPLGYYVQWNIEGTDYDYFPSENWQWAKVAKSNALMHHIKGNVPRSVKRGLSDFFPVLRSLLDDARLTRNTVTGAAAQAAIAWIEQFTEGATGSQIAADAARSSDIRQTVDTPGGPRDVFSKQLNPGTVIKVGRGKEYRPGPMGAERNAGFELVSQLSARRIAIRWNMPEYMISSDASNNNRASGEIAEGPFTKAREKDQRFFAKNYRQIFWKMLTIQCEMGRYSRFGVKTIEDIKQRVDIDVIPPSVASRDRGQQADTALKLVDAKLLSRETAQAQLDLEPETETQNIAQEQGVVTESVSKVVRMVQRSLWEELESEQGDYP